MKEVRIAEVGVRVRDAGPGGRVAELGLGNGPQGIALANAVFRWLALGSERSWHDNLGADLEQVGMTEAGVEGQEFLPAAPIAQARGGQLPERVAGLDGDGGQLSGDER